MKRCVIFVTAFVGTLALAGLLWDPSRLVSAAGPDEPAEKVVVSATFDDIMDTHTELTVIVAKGQEEKGQKAIKAAEAALRDVETKMSSHLNDTDIGKFNNAKVGEEVVMSEETRKVLGIARDYGDVTGGVFDITCRPLLQLWRQAGKAKRLPTDKELKDTLALVGWKHVKLTDKGAIKLTEGASLDLGGIAKKWGIDRAAGALQGEGILGGLVNVGGDLRCFGQPLLGKKWQVHIRSPFDKDGETLATMQIADGAVCTSGNYERFVIIDGKSYSHIVDPRTGRTADSVPSVTVYGKTAVDSGIWATTLSVTGPDGIKAMPKDSKLDVMMITGKPTAYKFTYTDGFKKLLNELPVEPLPPLPASEPTSEPRPGSAEATPGKP